MENVKGQYCLVGVREYPVAEVQGSGAQAQNEKNCDYRYQGGQCYVYHPLKTVGPVHRGAFIQARVDGR